MSEMRIFRNIRTGGLRVTSFPDDPGPDYVQIDEQEGAQLHLFVPARQMPRRRWFHLAALVLAVLVLAMWVWR